ncbi:hypothetical protein NPIL_416531 [Nephila pilipes]|uniref:Uncharacterized protein n=1 Tax=Nephila pilipes TaxID=299642 RepID=A0A8X6PS24_NEPPI|nr:hypothetical protein NPIL_416531 [Nephila pilipes]
MLISSWKKLAQGTLDDDFSPLAIHRLMSVLNDIAQVIKNINKDLKTLNLLGISIQSALILTKIDDLVNNPFKLRLSQYFPAVIGVLDVFIFAYFVNIASSVQTEYNATRICILNCIAKNKKISMECSKTIIVNAFLQMFDKHSVHFRISCMGLFDYQRSIILTSFSCSLTYGALLMRMD